MTEEQIRRELVRIAVSEIGKRNVHSARADLVVDFDDREVLEVLVILKHDAPEVSGKTYMSVLLKSYDFLHTVNDQRRPSLALDRQPSPSVSHAK